MSKQNKVNKNNYDQAGRLTPDDMARERKKMTPATPRSHERVTGKVPASSPGGRESSPDRSEREESE